MCFTVRCSNPSHFNRQTSPCRYNLRYTPNARQSKNQNATRWQDGVSEYRLWKSHMGVVHIFFQFIRPIRLAQWSWLLVVSRRVPEVRVRDLLCGCAPWALWDDLCVIIGFMYDNWTMLLIQWSNMIHLRGVSEHNLRKSHMGVAHIFFHECLSDFRKCGIGNMVIASLS